MYYEEKVIGGVLHCRLRPNEKFKPLSPEALTAMLLALRQVYRPDQASA